VGVGARAGREEAGEQPRSWHRGLTRQAVAAEALRLLDGEGRRALTMRRLATELDVKAASLYAHVSGKDDLVDAVLDAVLDEVVLPEPAPDPRETLAASFRAYRHTLVAHPQTVLLMNERARMSTAQVRLVERSMEVLAQAGVSQRVAVDTHVTLVAYALGFILQEVARPTGQPPAAVLESPVMPSVIATLLERSVDERFDVGIGIILDGALGPRS
jgi:AcrR family transcriptional regulator